MVGGGAITGCMLFVLLAVCSPSGAGKSGPRSTCPLPDPGRWGRRSFPADADLAPSAPKSTVPRTLPDEVLASPTPGIGPSSPR